MTPSAWLFYGANLTVIAALIAGAFVVGSGRTPIARVSPVFRTSGVAFLALCAITHAELAFHAAIGAHIINDDGSVSGHMWLLHLAQAAAAWTFLFSAAKASTRYFPAKGQPLDDKPEP